MPKKEIIYPPGASPRLGSAFAPATRFGDLVFVSGQAVINFDTMRGEGDFLQQTAQVMQRVKALVEAGGSNMENVLETTCWLADISNFPAFNEAYRGYFSNDPPARSTLQAPTATPDQHLEVAAIAGVSSNKKRDAILPSSMYRPVPPFSHATRFGNLVFVAGQSAYDQSVQGAKGDLRQQVRTTLDRTKTILEASGSSMENVLDCTCYLADRADFPVFNEEYAKYFPSNRPTRATLQMTQPARNGLVEIECVACTSDARKEVVNVPGMAASQVPLSPCTRVGNLVFVSGRATREPANDVGGQTKVVLEQIGKILEAAGTSLDNVLMSTCWLAPDASAGPFNEAYRPFFTQSQHARALIKAPLMAPEGLVEIGVTACIPD